MELRVTECCFGYGRVEGFDGETSDRAMRRGPYKTVHAAGPLIEGWSTHSSRDSFGNGTRLFGIDITQTIDQKLKEGGAIHFSCGRVIEP